MKVGLILIVIGIVLLAIGATISVYTDATTVTFEPEKAYKIPIEQRDKIEKFLDALNDDERWYAKHYLEVASWK